jgi:hypothetical protein
MPIVSQQPPGPESIGAIARSGLRGAIYPTRLWRLPGATGVHALKFDCGRLGLGPMHLAVDGRVVARFAKPGRNAPWIQTPPLTIDDRVVIVYAESHNNGDWVTVDVFADGTSLATGKSVTSIANRATVAGLASARYKSPMDPVVFARATIRGVVLGVSGFGVLRLLIESAQKSVVRAGLGALLCLALWLTGSVSLRVLERAATGRRRGLRAAAVVLVCLCLCVAIFGAVMTVESLIL